MLQIEITVITVKQNSKTHKLKVSFRKTWIASINFTIKINGYLRVDKSDSYVKLKIYVYCQAPGPGPGPFPVLTWS